MKINIRILLLLISCFFVIGCTESKIEEKRCVKCGGVATTALCGPADIIIKNGISLTECTPITSNIYSAPICEKCMGPVAVITPDP